MVRLLISTGIQLAANAIGLLLAVAILDDLSVGVGSFVIVVLLFTGTYVLGLPLIRQIAIKNVPAILGSVSLVATFVGLFVTNLISDGFEIHGFTTWLLATVIVWGGALAAGLALPLLVFREAAGRVRHRNGSSPVRGRRNSSPVRDRSDPSP